MADIQLNSIKCREEEAGGVSTELIKVYSLKGDCVLIVKSVMKEACIYMHLQLAVIQWRYAT